MRGRLRFGRGCGRITPTAGAQRRSVRVRVGRLGCRVRPDHAYRGRRPPLGGSVPDQPGAAGAPPPGVASACFGGPRRGWLGADGNIYGTVNGGRSWTLAVHGPIQPGGPPGYHARAEVECAGSGAGWAELNGPGAALSHMPQIGYHTYGRTWQPIFAERYTASPALRARVPAPSPGVYPGPFSAISPDQAVFIGWFPPCSAPASPPLLRPLPIDLALP